MLAQCWSQELREKMTAESALIRGCQFSVIPESNLAKAVRDRGRSSATVTNEVCHRGPKDHIKPYILVLRPKTRGIPEAMVSRILVFMQSVEPLFFQTRILIYQHMQYVLYHRLYTYTTYYTNIGHIRYTIYCTPIPHITSHDPRLDPGDGTKRRQANGFVRSLVLTEDRLLLPDRDEHKA